MMEPVKFFKKKDGTKRKFNPFKRADGSSKIFQEKMERREIFNPFKRKKGSYTVNKGPGKFKRFKGWLSKKF